MDHKPERPEGFTSRKDSIANVLGLRDVGVYGQPIEIDPKATPLTVGHFKGLLKFRNEISIHESSGKLVLVLGGEHHPQSDEEIGITSDSKLYLHTHPDRLDNTFVSMADVFTSERYGSETQLILATRNGFVVYKRPQFDPLRECPTDESARELMHEWGKANDIEFFGNAKEGQKDFLTLPTDERIRIARKFCSETQMIVAEAAFDDSEGIEKILSAINLQAKISDNRAPHIGSVADEINVVFDWSKLTQFQKAYLEAAIGHIDMVERRTGALLHDKEFRHAWKDFAIECIQKVRGAGVDKATGDYLNELEKRAKGLNIEN